MPTKTLKDLFIHSLSDIYSAEKQMTKSLPKMARASSSPDLRAAFEKHLEETLGQVQRIDQIVETSGIKLKRVKCVAMEGLVEEGQEQIDEIDKGPVLDTALIAAAQKVEHYEIAGYGCARTFARMLGDEEAAHLLQQTLDEEAETDRKLTDLAERSINIEAAHAAG